MYSHTFLFGQYRSAVERSVTPSYLQPQSQLIRLTLINLSKKFQLTVMINTYPPTTYSILRNEVTPERERRHNIDAIGIHVLVLNDE